MKCSIAIWKLSLTEYLKSLGKAGGEGGLGLEDLIHFFA